MTGVKKQDAIKNDSKITKCKKTLLRLLNNEISAAEAAITFNGLYEEEKKPLNSPKK